MKKQIVGIILLSINFYSQAQITFQKTFGGLGGDIGYSVQQTMDGGYIITGINGSSGGAGGGDVYVIKTDAYGDSLWTKSFGGINYDYGYSIQQTSDSGFVITGYTGSFGGGTNDIYLIKTDISGVLLWSKTFGGTDFDRSYSIQQTTDGGYIIAGYHKVNVGDEDVYLIKTDANGDSLWTKAFGGISIDEGRSVRQTMDGGYIITGYTHSFGAGNEDVYLIKTDANGDSLWTKTFGGIGNDFGYSVLQAADGGYIIAATAKSFVSESVYLVKTDANGTLLWSKTYGGTSYDGANSVQPTPDGGYIITGYTYSFGPVNGDCYLIRTDSAGNSLWTKTFGGTDYDVGYSAQPTADGGYIITGSTRSFGSGDADIYLIKTDANGNSGCNEGNPATIVNLPATLISNPATIVTSPSAVVTTPATIVSSGSIITMLCATVGISPTPALPGGEGVIIVPNPSSGNLIISFEQTIIKGNVEILNILGVPINIGITENIFNESKKGINLKNIPGGIYFVKVHVYPDSIGNGEKYYCKKVIIE